MLVRAIQDEALAQASAALQAAAPEEGEVRDAVRRAVQALLPLGMRFRVLLAEGADTDPDFLARRDEVLRPFQALVRKGVTRREFADEVTPAWIGTVLGSLLVATVRALDASLVSEDEAPELLCRTLFEGLGHEPRLDFPQAPLVFFPSSVRSVPQLVHVVDELGQCLVCVVVVAHWSPHQRRDSPRRPSRTGGCDGDSLMHPCQSK